MKIIANAGAGTAGDGASSAMNLFGPSAGLNLGAGLDAFGQTPEGRALLDGLQTVLRSRSGPPNGRETAN